MFNTDLYEEMKGYIQQVEKVYPNTRAIFTVPPEFIPPDKNYLFIPIENKGVDVYGFMLAIEFMRKYKLKTDWILKIHSKISNTNMFTPNVTDYHWRKQLIQPLVHPKFLPYLKTFNKVGYIGSSIHHLRQDRDFYQNKQGIGYLITQFPTIPSSSAGFIGGNMFWIHPSVVDQYITPAFIQYCKPLFSPRKPPSNDSKYPIIEYVIERILPGNMCWGLRYILIHQDGTFTIKGTK
jgi:hypothetical protein